MCSRWPEEPEQRNNKRRFTLLRLAICAKCRVCLAWPFYLFICMLERKNDQTKASKNKSNMWQHKAKRHSLKPQRSPLYNCQPDKESFQEGCQIALQIK